MTKLPNIDIDAVQSELARRHFKHFVSYTKPDYIFKPFNEYLMNRLDAFARGEIKKLMVFLPPQHGKQLADHTPVLTTNGWKNHGDLIPGDYVFGRNGAPVKVLATSEKTIANCEVTFSDGSVIQCHENHEWVVYDRSAHKEIIAETTYFLTEKLRNGIEKKRGNRNRFQVDWNTAVDFPVKQLPVHPYVLGAWLGDGSTGKTCITHHADDKEVIDKIISLGHVVSASWVHNKTGVVTTNFAELKSKLKTLSCYKEKHIPQEYLLSSKEQRLELLAGLIDTDGYVYHKNGRVTFSNINKRLIDDVEQLVISLGWRVTVCSFDPVVSTSGIKGKNIVYQLCFNPDYEIPLAITRKRLTNFKPAKRKRGIVSVTRVVNPSTGNCIEVEGGIYLAGRRLIPTHNSQLTTRITPAYILGKRPEKKIAISSYSATVAHEFARDAKNIITSPEYRLAFPETKVGRDVSVSEKGSYADTAHYYQTSKGGFIYSVGRGGSLTSKTIDVSIVDDPLKDRSEAMSQTVKNGLEVWYNDVVRTRLHNDSQELIILTRWVEDDLAGRLLKKEKDWEVIIFPAIKTENHSDYDHRQTGEPLFPEKHSLERLQEAKARNEVSFNSLYQQDPKPNKQLLVHPDFVRVKEFPMEQINKWIIGIDYGFNDQIAVVAIGCIENRRYWRILLYKPAKEIIEERKMQNVKFNDDVVDDITVEAVYESIKAADLLKAPCYSEHHKVKISKLMVKGLAIWLANKDVANGIEKVNNYHNYYLDSDEHTHNEVTKYQWQAIGEIILDKPVDGNDHIMNAGRYGIYTDSVLYGY